MRHRCASFATWSSEPAKRQQLARVRIKVADEQRLGAQLLGPIGPPESSVAADDSDGIPDQDEGPGAEPLDEPAGGEQRERVVDHRSPAPEPPDVNAVEYFTMRARS